MKIFRVVMGGDKDEGCLKLFGVIIIGVVVELELTDLVHLANSFSGQQLIRRF